jgi:hypothetical protein
MAEPEDNYGNVRIPRYVEARFGQLAVPYLIQRSDIRIDVPLYFFTLHTNIRLGGILPYHQSGKEALDKLEAVGVEFLQGNRSALERIYEREVRLEGGHDRAILAVLNHGRPPGSPLFTASFPSIRTAHGITGPFNDSTLDIWHANGEPNLHALSRWAQTGAELRRPGNLSSDPLPGGGAAALENLRRRGITFQPDASFSGTPEDYQRQLAAFYDRVAATRQPRDPRSLHYLAMQAMLDFHSSVVPTNAVYSPMRAVPPVVEEPPAPVEPPQPPSAGHVAAAELPKEEPPKETAPEPPPPPPRAIERALPRPAPTPNPHASTVHASLARVIASVPGDQRREFGRVVSMLLDGRAVENVPEGMRAHVRSLLVEAVGGPESAVRLLRDRYPDLPRAGQQVLARLHKGEFGEWTEFLAQRARTPLADFQTALTTLRPEEATPYRGTADLIFGTGTLNAAAEAARIQHFTRPHLPASQLSAPTQDTSDASGQAPPPVRLAGTSTRPQLSA